jgi:O-antigen/teichoic acid export membrane protein
MISINKLKEDAFLKHYVIYFIGSMIVAVLNYAFYPILGRLLSPSEFGDIQVLISLITQAGILFGAFSLISVNITANTENPHERNAILSELRKICVYIVLAIILVLLVFIFKLKSFLNLSTIYPIFGLVIILLLSSTATFRSAFLSGSKRFKELSINGIISSAGRIIFAIILIFSGLGPTGVILGIVLSQIAMLYFLHLRTSSSLHLNTKANLHSLEKGSIKKELVYGILVLFSTGLVTFIYTSDVLIIKNLFNAHDAGVYSGISAIGKIIFFLLSPITAVLMASVKRKNTVQENSAVLLKSLAISLILGVSVLLAFYLFSGIVVQLLLGPNYMALAYVLPKVGLVMFLSSIVNVFVYYFLALRRFFLIGISCVGILTLGILLWFYHNSINAVLNSLVVSLLVIIFLFFIFYVKNYFSRNTSI